jgi:hypothetical protein
MIKDQNGNPVQPDANEWYPIEYAPKDSTEVLIFCDGNIAQVSWEDIEGVEGIWITNRRVFYGRDVVHHFRPLPEPPVIEGM